MNKKAGMAPEGMGELMKLVIVGVIIVIIIIFIAKTFPAIAAKITSLFRR